MFQLPGCIGAALVDIQTGVSVAQIASKEINISAEAGYYATFLQSKQTLIKQLRLEQEVQDIAFTTNINYHVIYPFQLQILRVRPPENLFFYVIFAREDTNLASASLKIKTIISEFVF